MASSNRTYRLPQPHRHSSPSPNYTASASLEIVEFQSCTRPVVAHAVDREFQGVLPQRMREIHRANAKALASLHTVDVDTVGLGKFGRPNDYCKRQIERWFKQYLVSNSQGKPERNPKMFQLVDWLQKNIPLEDSSSAKVGLVHGDFHVDNLVFPILLSHC